MANTETSTGASNSGMDLTPLAPSGEMASSNDFDGDGNKSTAPPSTQLVLDPREVERMRGTWVLQPDDQSQAMANTETFSIVTGAPDTDDKLNVTTNTFQISPGASRAGTLHSETLKLKLKEAKKTFVPTKSFEDTKRILETNCHVTICGASGEGKTTMALMLGQEYWKQGFNLIFVDRADVFDFGSCLSSGQKFCIIFDDIFGSLGGSNDFTHVQRLCDSLKLHIDDNLQTRAIEKVQANERQRREDSPSVDENITPPDKKRQKPKEIYVIFTSKTYNFNKMKHQRIAFFRGKTVVDLTLNSESSYSNQEKIKIFQKHRDIHPKVKLGDLKVEEVIKQDSSLFGFPATCRLFFELSFTEKALDFFRRPLYYLRIELDQILNKGNDQAAALTLVLLCEGSINLSDLEITGRNKKVDDMLMHVMDFTSSATRTGIAAAVRSFRGTYLSNGDNTSFAHDSIYQACACSLYDINPSFVLQFCSLDFLFQKMKPSYVDEANVSERLNNLFVSEDYFSLVTSRLVTSLKEGIFSKTIAHPLTRNKSFVRMFLEEMCKLAMENKDWIQAKENGKGFLYWAVKSKNLDLIKDIETALQTDFEKQDITEGLFASVECDSLDILICLASKLETEPDQRTLNELLLASAKASCDAMVKYLLDKGSSISAADTSKKTFLHHLCIQDKPSLLKLVKSQANKEDLTSAIKAVDKEGRTPLMLAALNGTWDCFELLEVEEQTANFDCDGDGLVHLACKGGNKKIVEQVITPANMEGRGFQGMTPIMTAAWHAKSDVFDLLLSQNADVSLVDNGGNTLLHCACRGGSRDIAEHLVTSSNINTRGYHGRTPIITAALCAKSDVFDLLLSQNADVSLVDNDGDTLLHCACIGGSRDIAERLVTSSNINIRGFQGRTPVMEAAWYAKSDVFDLLLSQNADVSLVDNDGNTLLHCACIGGSRDIAERLVTSSNINTRGFQGRTPIMTAAWYAKSDVFDLLLSQNADVSLVDNGGNTLLHCACRGGSRDIAEHLVTSSNINTRGFHGSTPVMEAALCAKSDVFDLLLSQNADVSLVDNDGDTLLHCACIGGSRDIAERLVTSSNINTRGFQGKTPIMTAAWYAKSDVFDLLLSQNADISLVDNAGDTLLHCACIKGSRHIAERLVTSSNINTRDFQGRTPVMEAAWNAKSDVFDLLLSQHADVSLVDNGGNTLLHCACIGGSRHIAERLVTSSNINIRGFNGRTPIMTAAFYAKSDIFDLLLSQNADVSLVDNVGNTLLHCACIGGSRHIAERLVTSSNINTRGWSRRTPIMEAAMYGHVHIVELLREMGADLTCVDSEGNDVETLVKSVDKEDVGKREEGNTQRRRGCCIII